MTRIVSSQQIDKALILLAVLALFLLPGTSQAMLAIAFLVPFALALTLAAGALLGRSALLCAALLSLAVIAGTAVKSLHF
jgi:hypothetical protein